MPRIALHFFANPVRAILASGKIALFLFLASFGLTGAAAKGPVPGQFDYYVLALSWSPSYCAGEAGRNDHQQCAPGRRFAFVVHGLWPQYAKGWPEFCRTRENWIPQELIDGVMDVMPSKKLIIHEWKKHGSCSGLSQAAYFRQGGNDVWGVADPGALSFPASSRHGNARATGDGFREIERGFDGGYVVGAMRQCDGTGAPFGASRLC